MKLFEWLWRQLPDKCEADYCDDHGVRGNENRVHGMVLCDYCDVRYQRDGQIMARGRLMDYQIEQEIWRGQRTQRDT